MLRNMISAVILVALTQAALAQEDPTTRTSGNAAATPATQTASPSSAPKSRAEVKNAARNAEQSGAIPRGEASSPGADGGPTPSVASRAEVKAGAAGVEKKIEPIYGKQTQYFQTNEIKSTATRASVKDAAKQAEKDQTIQRGQAQLPNDSSAK